MALVAVTDINDGSDDVVHAGDTVKAGRFDKETLEHLKEIGSVVEPTKAETLEPDERDARIAELEAQLAELQDRGAKGPQGPTTPVSNPAGKSNPAAKQE